MRRGIFPVLVILGAWLMVPCEGSSSPPTIYYDDGPIVDGQPNRFVLDGRKWTDPHHLTFSFRNYSGDMTQLQIESAISGALAQWALACPQLGFAKIADNGVAHDAPTGAPPGAGVFRILFGGPSHGDTAFSSSTLAHAFFPPPNGTTAPGDVHFNDDFQWALSGAAGGGSPYDLRTVMLHEVGHSLGLRHEPTIDAVMNAIYAGPRGLSPDDVGAVRALYCPSQVGAAVPIDLVFVVDLTGSFGDDLPSVQAQMPSLLTSIQNTFTDIRFGVSTFKDFPFNGFGDPSDYVYRVEQTMTPTKSLIQTAFNNMAAGGGNDGPEAQYEAIHQALTGLGRDVEGNGSFGDPGDVVASPLGLNPLRLPVLFLLTDADFHDPDLEPGYPCAGCTSAGRTVVLADIAAKQAKIFVLIAATPPDVSAQQSGGAGEAARPLAEAAQELAEASGGGVLNVGTSSEGLSTAVTTGLLQVQYSLRGALVSVPTLSLAGLSVLLISIAAAGWALLRRRRRAGAAP